MIMLSFTQYLNENFKNFIGPDSIEDRRKYADEVWDILQKSYAHIGGMKGSGFGTKEDIITNIPFWKLYTKNDKVIAAVFYKDKNGRKAVAIATDGSDVASKVIDSIYKASLGVAYGEKSGRALGKMMKATDWKTLEPFLMKPEHVKKITGDDTISVDKFGYDSLEPDDKFTYDKYPKLRPYMYVRSLGGEMHLKVSMGTPNLPIVKK
jgi:hypothetical protein